MKNFVQTKQNFDTNVTVTVVNLDAGTKWRNGEGTTYKGTGKLEDGTVVSITTFEKLKASSKMQAYDSTTADKEFAENLAIAKKINRSTKIAKLGGFEFDKEKALVNFVQTVNLD